MNNDDKKITGGDTNNVNPEELDKTFKQLEELTERAKANAKQYTKIKTKLYKGKLAPQGSLFFGVTVKDKSMVYKTVALVNCNGKDDDTEQLLYNELFTSLCKRYNLTLVKNHKIDVENKTKRFL